MVVSVTLEQSAATMPMVVHIIPSAVARGAQHGARELADRLDRFGSHSHRVLTMFAGPTEVPVDMSLDHPGKGVPGVGVDLRLVLRLRSFLIDLDPAAVVAHGSEPLKYLVPAMVDRHRPLAYHAIGTYSGSHRRTQERLWKFLHGRPDLIIAVGEEVRSECIERFGVPEHDVVFVPNGRDPTTFRPRAEGARAAPPQVLFVGALTVGKRPERFIAAVQNLRTRGVSFSARMVGTGPLHRNLEDSAKAAGVELMGSRSDVPDLLRQADVLAFASLPSGEGMPGVLIEAGLSGLPVVATDVPGVRSVVDHGITGFVVGTADMDAIVAALGKLLDDSELRTSMGQAARRHCLTRFDIDSVAEQWSTALQPLLKGAGPGHGRRRTRRARA
jgi:glycosyltransferase involved in cell wall biosynthesis